MSTAPLEQLAALADPAWLVGGSIRDELLRRPVVDYDVVLAGEPRTVARALGSSARAHVFALSEAFGAWRVLARDGAWRIDLTPLAGGSLESDLARRDLTINAIARPLIGGELIDPHGGQADLAAQRLRMVGPGAFARGPAADASARPARCRARFRRRVRDHVGGEGRLIGLRSVAPERVFAELRQIVCGARPAAGLLMMEEVGATAAVLPELLALRGVEQSQYHHLDVYDHTIAALERVAELVRDPSAQFGEVGGELERVLGEPLADELNRGQALRFGALLHDIAKPSTRAVNAEGRVTFFGHDRAGAEQAAAIIARLRGSERLATHVAALAQHHLRLGFLVREMPLDRRTVYRYLSACDPVQIDVTLLSVADRLATLGRSAERAVEAHLELARALMPAALGWRASPPRPPLRGDELAAALGIAPGPEIGRLLEVLTEAAYSGEVEDAGQAVALARELRAGGAPSAAG